jgi:hypothetical protein
MHIRDAFSEVRHIRVDFDWSAVFVIHSTESDRNQR